MFRSSNGKRRRRLPSLLLHANASRQSKPQAAALPLKPFCGRGWEKTRLRPARTPFLEIPCQIPGTWCPSPCPSPFELGPARGIQLLESRKCCMDPKYGNIFHVSSFLSYCACRISILRILFAARRQATTAIMHRESLEGGVSQSIMQPRRRRRGRPLGNCEESRRRSLIQTPAARRQTDGRRPNLKAESHFPPRPQKGFKIQRQGGRLDCLLASYRMQQ